MTLSGTASVADYQAALRSVTYYNSSDNPSSDQRTINFQANDGATNHDLSNVATSTVDVTPVNDAPVVDSHGSTLSYTENGAPAAIDAALTVSDVDSTALHGATVSIGDGFHSGEDVLGFTSQHGISGSFNTSTGVLTLSGTASVADYEAALRSVTYWNSSDNPSSNPRTVNFQVNDGAAAHNLSNTATTTVDVTPVNDAPVLNHFNLSVAQGSLTVLSTSDFQITDPDSSSFTFSVGGVGGGHFETTSDGTNWTPGATFTTSEIALDHVRFVQDGSATTPNFTILASDGSGASSSTISPTVNFVQVANSLVTTFTGFHSETINGVNVNGYLTDGTSVGVTVSDSGNNDVSSSAQYSWEVLSDTDGWKSFSQTNSFAWDDGTYAHGKEGEQLRLIVTYGTDKIATYFGNLADNDSDSNDFPVAIQNLRDDSNSPISAITIDANTELELAAACALSVFFPNPASASSGYGTLVIDHAGGYLVVDQAGDNTKTISNFGANSAGTHSDAIDLKDISYSSITDHYYSSGALHIIASGHDYQLSFSGSYATDSFSLFADGHGGTLITDPPPSTATANTALTTGTDHLTLDNGTHQVAATDHTLSNGDVLTGGSGNDTLTVDIGNGDHSFTFGDGSHNDIGLANFETLKLTDASATSDHAVTVDFDSHFQNNGTLTVDGSGLHHLGASHLTLDAHLATSDAFVFIGSASADTIIGGAKADTITGGGGGDTLTGNGGHDTFVFKAVSDSAPGVTGGHAHYDTITDFTHNADHIDVAAIAGLNDHHQAVDIASLSATPHTIAPHAIDIVTSGDHSVVYANASGTAQSVGSTDMEIHLSHTTNVTATDFILHH